MKNLLMIAFIGFALIAKAQNATTESMLLKHLKDSHTDKNWFVPINEALQNMTAEQAMWTDGSGNHSVGQLAHHLLFWNQRMLKSFRGEKNEKFNGDNNETFSKFDSKQWNEIVLKLDNVMVEIESVVEGASEDQLKEWAPILVNISAHNAYHTGQIVFVRKQQGSWKSEYGVN